MAQRYRPPPAERRKTMAEVLEKNAQLEQQVKIIAARLERLERNQNAD